ncbi:MAG: bifunctional phosphoglucose/phosphomannose isomerase [Firmicutes bacterium HGW-Firmicutes-15]|nr:MAG: bifunctional phosphoglucose/phosphomannose isomerase [Firmicutes bacterium HGW-Firmicutes-15]
MTVEKMAEYLWGLPEQFASILEQGISLPVKYQHNYSNIVVTGLGGSAIGGDIIRTYALQKAQVPVIVNRDYDMPNFVNSDSLVLTVSYSGNTEETLSAYHHARTQGAAIIAVTSGGKLADIARQDGYGVVKIPGGLAPRAATGYLFAPLALIFEELGIVKGAKTDLKETVQVLKAIREGIHPGVDFPENQARVIAREMKDSLPIIWGSSARSETAAMRWKTQINENAKSPTYYNIFPELNHNEIVGFGMPKDLLARLVIIILRDPADHPQVKKRIEISKEIVRSHVKKIVEIQAQGESFLAKFYSLAYMGDYASFYLALEYGINPSPVETIDYLKAELAKA